jgi:hypothetical protein
MLEQLVKSMKIIGWAGLLYAGGTFFSGNACATECIMLKNGEEVRCDIIERQEGGYRVRLADGTTNVYSKSSIDSLVHEDDNQVCKEPMKQEETAPVVENKVELPVPKIEPKEPPKNLLPPAVQAANEYETALRELLSNPQSQTKDILSALENMLENNTLPAKGKEPVDYASEAKTAADRLLAKRERRLPDYVTALLLTDRQIREYNRFNDADLDKEIPGLKANLAAYVLGLSSTHLKINPKADVNLLEKFAQPIMSSAYADLQALGNYVWDTEKSKENPITATKNHLSSIALGFKVQDDKRYANEANNTNRSIDYYASQSRKARIQELESQSGQQFTWLRELDARVDAKVKAAEKK